MLLPLPTRIRLQEPAQMEHLTALHA
jgi:hypothetical protein